MIGYNGKVWNEPSGPQAWGWSVFNRIYLTADGGLFIASAEADKLAQVPELCGIDFSSPEVEKELAARIKENTSAFWYETLSALGAECRILRDFSADVMEEPYAKTRGLSRTDDHPGLGVYRVSSCAPRLSLTPPIPGFPVAAAGADTEKFLTEFKRKHPEL